MLVRMVTSDVGSVKDAKGRFLIDRDGRMFRHVLEFLRNGKMLAMEERLLPALEEELRYFAIHGLQDEVSDASLKELRVAATVATRNGFLEKYEATSKKVLCLIMENVRHRVEMGRSSKAENLIFVGSSYPKNIALGHIVLKPEEWRVVIERIASCSEAGTLPQGLATPPLESHVVRECFTNIHKTFPPHQKNVVYMIDDVDHADISKFFQFLSDHARAEFDLSISNSVSFLREDSLNMPQIVKSFWGLYRY